MQYQLVLQFPEDEYGDFDWLVDLEDQLEDSLQEGELDGHDMGSGEVNIFIHTNDPNATFESVKPILEEKSVQLEKIKVGYRAFSEEEYTPIWPQNLSEFTVI